MLCSNSEPVFSAQNNCIATKRGERAVFLLRFFLSGVLLCAHLDAGSDDVILACVGHDPRQQQEQREERYHKHSRRHCGVLVSEK